MLTVSLLDTETNENVVEPGKSPQETTIVKMEFYKKF